MATKTDGKGIGAQTTRVATSVLVGRLINFVLTAASFIVVARMLGPAVYGVYTLILAMIGILSAVGDLGISTALTRFISSYVNSREPGRISDVVANSFFMLAVVGLIIAIATFLLSGPIAAYVLKDAGDAYAIQVAALAALLLILYNGAYAAVIGLRKGRYIVLTTAAQSLLQSVVSIVLVVIGIGALAPIIGLIAGYAAGILAAAPVMPRGRVSLEGVMRILAFSLPLGLSGIISMVVNNIALIALGLFATDIVVGNFGIASRTGNMIDIVTGSISISLMSSLSVISAGRWKKRDVSHFYNYSLYLTFVIVCPMLFFIIMLSTPVSYVAFSGTYKLAPLYISVLCAGLLVNIVSSCTSNVFVSTGKVEYVLKCGIITAVVELALLPFILPALNGLGLSIIIFVVPPVIGAMFYVSRTKGVFGIGLETKRLARVLAANVISFLLAVPVYLLLSGDFISLLVIVGIFEVLVYPIVLARTGGILNSDIKKIKGVSSRVPVVSTALGCILRYTGFFVPQ